MIKLYSDQIQRAVEFCKNAHDSVGQRRKYTNEPYWVHPIEVMQIVKRAGGTEAQQIAALLHDTVEDTNVTLEEITAEFGGEVAKLVEMLTDVSRPSDGNRAKRKQLDLEHTRLASPEAKTIKLADLISNSRSIKEHDPGFAAIYFKEKERLLEVLTEGNQTLLAEAREIVKAYRSVK